MYGPVIVGSRFRMRPPAAQDAETMIAWFEDLEVTRFVTVRFPPSADQERDWLRRLAESQTDVFWVIEHEGRAVGGTGIHGIDWASQHGTTGTVIGDRSVWGRGIAGEMMRLRADYAFTHLPLRKLKSAYVEGNEASWRAQRRAGYREVGRLRQERFWVGHWLDVVLTELLREDWERARAQRSGPTGTPT